MCSIEKLTNKKTNQGTNLQNIQTAQTTLKTKQNKTGKWAKDLNRYFSKETYRWPKSTWRDVQHHSLLEKCKSKLQWDTTSHQPEWPSSKSLWTINAEEGMEKRQPSYTVGGNVNWYSHHGG